MGLETCSLRHLRRHVNGGQSHATPRRLHDSHLQLLLPQVPEPSVFGWEKCRCSMNIDTMLTTIERAAPHNVFFSFGVGCHSLFSSNDAISPYCAAHAATSHFAAPAKEKVEPQKGLWLQSICRTDATC